MKASSPTYRETVAIGWRIFWQAVAGFLLILFLVNLALLRLLPELTRTGAPYWALAVPLFVAAAVLLFVLLPLVARGLLTKPFDGFSLALVRNDPSSGGSFGGRMKGMTIMRRHSMVASWILALVLAGTSAVLAAPDGDKADIGLHLVSGTLTKLDLVKGRGLLTTDLGRPVYFDVPKAYLFENVTVGARISLRLDDHGRAVRVMDSAVADVVLPPDSGDLSAGLGEESHGR